MLGRLHGDADEYTPVAPCRDYAARIRDAGTPVEFIVIEGARQKFDAADVPRLRLRAVVRTLAECQIETDIDTMQAHERGSGERLSGDACREALKKCSAVGATIEGSRAARDKAAQAMTGFLRRLLAVP